MKNKTLIFTGIPVLILFLTTSFMSLFQNTKDTHPVKFTILYDNYSSKEDIKTAWGFSCLIESNNKTILFDTGGNADILKHNVESLNIDLSKIDIIVISHEHWDHVGGLKYILEENSDVTVYVTASITEDAVKKVESTGAKVIKTDKTLKISENIYLTGEMMNIEQSLIADTPKGAVIVTGCSHQGITNIIKKSKEIIDTEIFLVFGGFHLLRHSKDGVAKIIEEFKIQNVEKCGATHCTGGSQIQQLKDAFGEEYFEVGAGKCFTVSEKGIEIN